MRLVFGLLLLLPFLSAFAQSGQISVDQESVRNGRELYQDHCSRCHELGQQKVGPSLASVVDKRSVGWLLGFIQGSQQIIESGDSYAVYLNRRYSHMVMPDFTFLDEDARMDILSFIKAESQAANHSYAQDSINYYDAEILMKAEQRASTTQEGEIDYYALSTHLVIPDDTETILEGKTLFMGQCSRCHQLDLRTTGPALASVTDRRPLPWLLDYLESPKALLTTGDDYANGLAMNYPLVMPDFDFLDTEDKLAVLAYIRYASGAPVTDAGINANRIADTNTDSIRPYEGIEDQEDPLEEEAEEEAEDHSIVRIFGLAFSFFLLAVLAIIVWRTFRMRK